MTASLLLVSLALAAPVPKAATPELKWRFTRGDTYYVRQVQEATTRANVGGGPGGGAQGPTTTITILYKVSVTSAGAKETVWEWECVSFAQEVNLGAGAAPVKPANKDASGKVLKFTLDEKHKVTKVEGADELAKATGGGGFETTSEDGLKYMVDQLLRSVPGKALGKGEKWNAELEGSILHGLTTKKTTRGTVADMTDGVAKLAVESDYEWTGSANQGVAAGGVSIVYNLKGEKGPGTITFDTIKGRLKKLEETMPLSGSVTIGGAGAGGKQQIDLSVSMKTTVTVTDDMPKKE